MIWPVLLSLKPLLIMGFFNRGENVLKYLEVLM